VIKSFSWAMIFGVLIGTYSSIFIAAPVLIYLGVRNAGEAEKIEEIDTSITTPKS
jgi:preprotein translocase subunit SecF